MDNGTHSSSSDYEMASKEKENRRATFEKKMHCYSLKNQDDALFRNSPKRPAFVLIQLKTMLNAIGEVIVSPAT